MKKNTAVIHATKSHVASRGKQYFAHTLTPSFRSLLFLFAAGMFLFSCDDPKEIKPSSEATMTTLTLTVESKDYEIPFTNKQGTIKLPYSTKLPVTAKVAAVQLSAKATGVKVGDDVMIPDSESFTLTVTAEDKTTTETYTVTVNKAAASKEATMTTLTLTVEDTDYEIPFTNKQGTITIPYSTELPVKAKVKAVQLSAKATGVKVGDDVMIPDSESFTLTVTAEDKTTTETYTVTVNKAAASKEATMTTLTLTVEDKDYEIPFTNKQGTITVPYSTELPADAVVKAVELSAKATGVKVGDEVTIPASDTFALTVTAEDGTTTETYTVTVQKAAARKEASLTSLTLTVEDEDYEVTFTGTQDTLRVVPYGTPIPTTAVGVKQIELSPGATTDAGDQLTVTNDTVTLTVTAEDGTTKNTYTVRLAASVGMTSFTFEVTDNESMALDEDDRKQIVGMINQQAGTITFAEQSAYVYRDKLKATFEVSEEGAAVQVGGEPQASGTTEQDFRSPVSYVVRAPDGTETTYTVTLLKSTLATIEDATFRRRLRAFVSAAFTGVLGEELDITHSDVTNYSGIMDLGNQTPKLTSLKGIEFFTALKSLECYENSLSSLNVSRNTALTDLNCLDNSLESLDVSGITALTLLYCGNNSLTSLDVSASTALRALTCNNNSLTSLDLGRNTALTLLYCDKNSLTALDITGMRSLTDLNIVIGTGTGDDNPLLATLRVNTALQDRKEIITMKTNRGADLTITTVNNEGDVVCNDYDPSAVEDKCN